MTVYELAVIKLTKAARMVAEINRAFNRATFDEFRNEFMQPNSPTYGLPLSVFDRALKEAYREFTGMTPNEGRDENAEKA